MYNVSANFHNLAIQDAPKTRVRIYFIGPTIDCTDDNDVTTNGTLLVWAAGDTDSNKRIGQDGIKITEYYNPEYNITLGRAVSSQIEMTLLNTDGGLNNFSYGRCKVYLDVYDSVNSAWLACPMGVYIIGLPTRRQSQLIHAFGYDQMQTLDDICDTWWAGLNWTGGLSLLQIVQSMGAQVGFSVSTASASAIVNSSVTYTAAPFDCVEVTYREVLESVAEATGTIARFDRDGALDLKWFDEAQISGNTVQIDTDTVGNQCLGIDLAEYQVAAIDKLKVKIAEDDQGVVVGSGTNQYTILDNLFLDGTVATITARSTPIYNRLNGLGAYKPIQANMIWDWSIEAGDIIEIVRDSTTYTYPIFQQTMTWRGGYVVSDLVNSGDSVRPVPAYNERSTYRMQSEMSAKVGDNEIISKINQSPEAITIQANKISLLGYTTINNGFKVNLDGTFEANGATINGSLESNGSTRWNDYPVKTSISNGDINTVLDLNGTDKTIFYVENLDSFHPGEYWATLGIRGDIDGNGERSTSFQPGSARFYGIDHIFAANRLGAEFIPTNNNADNPSWNLGRSYATFNVPVRINDFFTVASNASVIGDFDIAGDTSITGGLTVGGLDVIPFLTAGTEIPSNADLNTYKTPGVYYATYAVAQTLSNSQFTTTGIKLVVMPLYSTLLWQIEFVAYDNCKIALRYYNGSTWAAWKVISPA